MRSLTARQGLARPPHAPAGRGGFTLAELIVAIVLLTVGLSALAATSVWLLTETTSSRRSERAAVLAHSRLEVLRMAGCSPVSDAVNHGDLIEQWSLSVESQRAIATVTIAPRDSGRIREQRYRTAFPC